MIGFSYLKNATLTSLLGSTPSLSGLDLTGITDDNIPYMSASGFADSPLTTDGATDIGIALGAISLSENLHIGDEGRIRCEGARPMLRFKETDGSSDENWQLEEQGGVFKISTQNDAFTSLSVKLTIDQSGNVGIGEAAPVTLIEATSTTPYITLHNSTHEDTDGGRESRLIARGEQSGGEETILGLLEFAHDGASDDQKGLFRVLLNDGDDGTTPSLTALTCGSTGEVQFHQTAHFDVEVDNGNSGATDTIDWTAGNKQKSTLTDNCEFTFSPEPSGPCSLTLKLVQDGTGSRTVTWPGDVKWPGGTAPTLSTGAADVDIITFYYDGTDFYGQSALDFS